MKYKPPTSLDEFKYWSKFNCHIEDEVWKFILIKGWEEFQISNYCRIKNIATGKLRTLNLSRTYGLNSYFIRRTIYIKNDKDISLTENLLDIARNTFYPDMDDTYINPISKDGNIFNLSLDNIEYVPNTYYTGDSTYRNKWIYIDNEKSRYTIDTDGVIINQKTNRIIMPSKNLVNSSVTLTHRNVKRNSFRGKYLSNTFIENPYNLKFVRLKDKNNKECDLSNIYLSNRLLVRV